MKKYLILFIGLSFLVATGAMAQFDNWAETDQYGNANSAFVAQLIVGNGGDNYSNIFTVGDGNRALVLQRSADDVHGGYENWSSIVQFFGFYNTAVVLQNQDRGGTNWSYINQSLLSGFNWAIVLQNADRGGDNTSVVIQAPMAWFSTAFVLQNADRGGENYSYINQYFGGGTAIVLQIADRGGYNESWIAQGFGLGNFALVGQYASRGSSNHSDIVQNGWANTAVHLQFAP